MNRRALFALAAVSVVGAAVFGAFFTLGGRARDTGPLEDFPAEGRVQSAAPVLQADFTGAQSCQGCHAAQFASWQSSTHGRAGAIASEATIIARFDGTPIRFSDADVIPSRTGGVPTFTVRRAGQPDQVFRVDGVVGGGHMQGGGTQGFVSKYPDGSWRFLPFDFSRTANTWFCNTNSRENHGWVPITPQLPLSACGDWPPARMLGDEARVANCSQCHGSQISVRFDTTKRAYDTRFTSLSVNCESCHGPGRQHIERVRAGGSGVDLGMRQLAALDKQQSVQLCLQCHAVKDQLQPGYLPGMPLDRYYSAALALLGDSPLHPDGRVKSFAYQEGHLFSDCYRNGGMTCTDCHDPHTQGYRDVNGTALPTRFDDRQCTSCHVSKSIDVPAHTKHAATSPGSRCVSCHMPYLQHPEIGNRIRYARSDHTIPVPRPASDSALGVSPSCVACHSDRTVAQLDADVRRLWGTLKPRPPLVEAQLATYTKESAAGRALLDGDNGNPAATFSALAMYLTTQLGPDMPALSSSSTDRLLRLAGSQDLEVRALALAALHYARGNSPTVRRTLVRSLASDGSDIALRRRWAIILGYLGDVLAAKNDARGAITAYEKALQIQPTDAQLLLSYGRALAQSGNAAGAADAYRRSLAAQPGQSLAWVNLGQSLGDQGDLQGAAAAFRHAIALNPWEAIAYANLGNAFLVAGQQANAAALYVQALRLDPTLNPARVQLAQLLASAGRSAEALAQVNEGLQFRRDDAALLALRSQLVR